MSISLSSIKKRTAADKPPPFLTIYGVPGVGKTSLAAEAPAPVFLRTAGEDFPTGVEVDEIEVGTFGAVIETLGVLANEDHEFRTVALDAADGFERLVWVETCARNGWSTVEDPGFGKGYVAAVDVWNEIISGLNYLRTERRMNVIALGHETITTFQSPTTDPYSRYGLNLQKRAVDAIENASDVVAFLNYRITLKEKDLGFKKTATHGEGGGTRVIHVEERPGFVAKNRYGMPPSLDYRKGHGWSDLAKFIPSAAA